MPLTRTELERYFARIDYHGPREPTLPALHALTAAHSQHIPFENIDVLLGRRIDLAPEALFDKLVERRRGGYCFEQNGLFLEVLTSLGFAVKPLSARVRLDRPRDVPAARTHLFLRVELDGVSWLTDVGIGGVSLTSAVRFDPGVELATPHEPRRIVREDERWFHQVRFGTDWADVYEFTGEEMPLIDREVANWYTSTHPESHFRHQLIVARAGADGRRSTLSSTELKTRERDGRATVRAIASPEELLDALAEHFDLDFEPGTRFEPAAPAVASSR